MKTFQFAYREVELLEDFAKALEWLATEPRRFIIRGQLLPGLAGWQRRLLKATRDEAATVECPLRSWIVFDFDGVEVPERLGLPGRLAEAGYYIRDKLLPPYFRGIRCIVSSTAKTGRVGAGIARLRMWFLIAEPADNLVLYNWMYALWDARPDLRLDPSVMEIQQPIYTARPIFDGCTDPVPSWDRVRLLDGYEDYVTLEDLPKLRKARKQEPSGIVCGNIVCDIPAELLDMTAEDVGLGVHAIDTSDKAWQAIKTIFAALDGCPPAKIVISRKGDGRHATLNAAAFWLAKLVDEGELTETVARDAYFTAAEGIVKDERYDGDAIQRHWDDAFEGRAFGTRC
jgi:hypothetical protein